MQTKSKVLIVDDSQIICNKITQLLSDEPNVEIVGHALTGMQALQYVNEFLPDVVLLDISMPGFNGIDILTWIRNRYRDMKVIMLTNYSDNQYRTRCSSLGANLFFDKSTEFEKVPSAISGFLMKGSKAIEHC